MFVIIIVKFVKKKKIGMMKMKVKDGFEKKCGIEVEVD